MLSHTRQSGVTLIELMITIVIAGILLGLAATSYKDWIQNQQVRTAAESILSGLQITRAEAVKNNTNVRVVLCGLPDSSWEILAASAAASAPVASSVCTASPAPAIAGEVRVQQRSGQDGSRNVVIAATPAAAITTTFNGLGRVVANADGSASITQVDVSIPNGTRPLRITQGATGNPRMCDPSPLLAATDPRHC